MTLKIHNTLTRSKQVFAPADPARVTVYVCGPTVYDRPHIGNARPAVVFDVLRRLLTRLYPKVVYASNVTDVEDKIIASARAEGVSIDAITTRYGAVYRRDMRALGVADPDLVPKVTATIPEIIDMIGRLLTVGAAYEAAGHVLFHVPSHPDYGTLSNRSRDEMIAGARVEVAPYKQDPADFVLWKPSDAELPGWESPWGRGRPGWHIECSAMIEKYLGETIDIHAGGQDLIFPHHENEMAQSACVHGGKPLARYWMHNGMLRVEGRKMSKSVGNVLATEDIFADHPAEAVRLLLLTGRYRQPLDFSTAGLLQAKKNLDRIYRALAGFDGEGAGDDDARVAAVKSALLDDLNTPAARALIFAITGDLEAGRADPASLKGAAWYLGLGQQASADWFAQNRETGAEIDTGRVEALVAAREKARAARDFAEADRLRDAIEALGVALQDGPEGTVWRKG